MSDSIVCAGAKHKALRAWMEAKRSLASSVEQKRRECKELYIPLCKLDGYEICQLRRYGVPQAGFHVFRQRIPGKSQRTLVQVCKTYKRALRFVHGNRIID